MKRVHIIGGKNHGKTTLVAELVAEFRARGLRVGTIKHTHHHHELDTPGKDSHRHREAGAEVVGILSRSMNAVFWSNPEPAESGSLSTEERYRSFAPAFFECDLVLVEGDTQTTAAKLEVWRAALDTPPVAKRAADVRAIVSDDPVTEHIHTLRRSDVSAVADFITQILNGKPDEESR